MPRARSRATARCPALYAGCPQHVWERGTSTWHPASSSRRIAAKPMLGRWRSTRQVTNRPTRGLPTRGSKGVTRIEGAAGRSCERAASGSRTTGRNKTPSGVLGRQISLEGPEVGDLGYGIGSGDGVPILILRQADLIGHEPYSYDRDAAALIGGLDRHGLHAANLAQLDMTGRLARLDCLGKRAIGVIRQQRPQRRPISLGEGAHDNPERLFRTVQETGNIECRVDRTHTGQRLADGTRGVRKRATGDDDGRFGPTLDHRASGGSRPLCRRIGLRRPLKASSPPKYAAQAKHKERRDHPEQDQIQWKSAACAHFASLLTRTDRRAGAPRQTKPAIGPGCRPTKRTVWRWHDPAAPWAERIQPALHGHPARSWDRRSQADRTRPYPGGRCGACARRTAGRADHHLAVHPRLADRRSAGARTPRAGFDQSNRARAV